MVISFSLLDYAFDVAGLQRAPQHHAEGAERDREQESEHGMEHGAPEEEAEDDAGVAKSRAVALDSRRDEVAVEQLP